MKLALYQAPPTDGDIAGAFDRLARALRAAAAMGARMLVAPELYLPGYNRPDLHARDAEPISGDWLARLAEMAAAEGCGLTLGWAERAEGQVWNSAVALCPEGRLLAHYRKIQLYGEMEKTSFVPGEAPPPVFDFEGRRCGLLICYDIEFPGHAAALAARGVDLILVPTANPAGAEHVQNVLVPARAHENRQVIAYANYCGVERGLAFSGLSVIAGPDARPIAMAGTRETLLIVDLPSLADHRPDQIARLSEDYRAI